MEKVVLPNGLTVIYQHKPGNSVVVEVMAKVGSNDETASERGISHFLEHILFEGTTRRPSNHAITNEIEKIGGDFNAYTTNERTCFHIKVLPKHFSIAVDVLADILQHSLLRERDIKKEKNVVLKEIDLVHDEPRYYQWVLFQQHLFQKHPSKYPTYGDRKVITGLRREKVTKFFQKYYQPSNMVVCIVGDVHNWKKEITTKLMLSKGAVTRPAITPELPAVKASEKKEKKKNASTYTIMGFKTVPRTHHDAYVLEIINGILGRGQSGWMFTELRGKLGLGYEVGTQHIAERTYGYFAVYATIDKKNVKLVKSLMLREMKKLQQVTEQDLQEAKDFIEGSYYLELDDSQKLADQILFWEQVKDAHLLNEFLPTIKKITVKEVQRVARQYLKNPLFVVLEGR